MKSILLLSLIFLTMGPEKVPAKDKWYQAPSLHIARGGAAAINYGGSIYVFGGKSFNNSVLNSVERYDLQTHSWDTSAVPAFQYPRYNASVVEFGGKLYLMGGRDNNKVCREVEVYDPAQNSWSSAHNLRKGRESLAGAVFNDRIYAIGGQEGDYQLIDEIEWYDQPADNWLAAVFDLPHPRAAHFSGVDQNNFYMFGGYYYGLMADCYKAEPGSSGYQWIKLTDLDQARAYGASACVRDEIFLLGGETTDGKTNTVQVFNTTSETFGPCEPFSVARSGLAAVTVRDTIIYIMGGFETEFNEPVATVEYYYGDLTTDIEEEPVTLPENNILISGYPNPFNNSVNLDIIVRVMDVYEVAVYNLTGQKLAVLYKGDLAAGKSHFRWQAGEKIASGLYILTVQSKNYFQNFKLVLLK